MGIPYLVIECTRSRHGSLFSCLVSINKGGSGHARSAPALTHVRGRCRSCQKSGPVAARGRLC
ncbi:Hypothetical protein RAK1035_0219 [Roseovarius sp. AK1035]|nr:Hypothetical protein RAK1035_0219 [Roseovarius sp. AK1035]